MTIDEEFESQFMRTGDLGSGNASIASFGMSKRSAIDVKNRDEIKRIEKEKKEQVEV
jgi:hypothetical protein